MISKSIKVYYSPDHYKHNPRTHSVRGRQDPVPYSDYGHPECASRFSYVLNVLEESLGNQMNLVYCRREATHSELESCHDINMIEFLSNCWNIAEKQGQDDSEILPSVYPCYVHHTIPIEPKKDILAEVGKYCFDTCTPIGEFTIEISKKAAAASIDAAKELSLELDENGQSRCSYVLIRPPGHHTTRNMVGGFCYFNSSALAAKVLLNRIKNEKNGKRVVIIDIDYHHGNGTQDIFYSSSEVVYCSIHANPNFEYPHFTGGENEKGTEEGEGYNFNFPLPKNATFEIDYIPKFKQLLECASSTKPDALLVSLGLDGMNGDTIGKYNLTVENFEYLGKHIREQFKSLPTLIVQEGGYNKNRKTMAEGISSFLSAWL